MKSISTAYAKLQERVHLLFLELPFFTDINWKDYIETTSIARDNFYRQNLLYIISLSFVVALNIDGLLFLDSC